MKWTHCLLLAFIACRKPAPASELIIHRADSLPVTQLEWLNLRDHFIATVGPNAGQGHQLGPLVVLADATFAPHSRFPTHGHREMEILSIVISGELSHQGDQSNGTTLPARSAQLISTRSGMQHAEGNDSDAPVRMLQVWIEPTTHGGDATYFQRAITQGPGQHLIAGDDVMPLRADAKVYWLDVPADQQTSLTIAPNRVGYLLVLNGSIDRGLTTGDGAEIKPGTLSFKTSQPTNLLFIDAANGAHP